MNSAIAFPQSKADSLYSRGEYFEASIAYEWELLDVQNFELSTQLLLKKSNCFKQEGEYNKALEELKRIQYVGISKGLALQCHYETALCAYLGSEFSEAERELLIIMHGYPENKKSNEFYLLQVLNYNMLQKWDSARKAALQYNEFAYADNEKKSKKEEIEKLYSKKNLPKLKSMKKLDWYKLFPGLGQVYAGSLSEGMLNFGINFIALSYGVYEVWLENYFTGYFIGALTINKFYFGGHSRAKFLLEKNNHLALTEFNEKVKQILTKKPA